MNLFFETVRMTDYTRNNNFIIFCSHRFHQSYYIFWNFFPWFIWREVICSNVQNENFWFKVSLSWFYLISIILGHSLRFWVSTNHQQTSFKKTVSPKNVSVRHSLKEKLCCLVFQNLPLTGIWKNSYSENSQKNVHRESTF